jgi:hypothetical protein
MRKQGAVSSAFGRKGHHPPFTGRGCEKTKSAFGFWPMAYSLVCDSVLKLLIQVRYDIKPEI